VTADTPVASASVRFGAAVRVYADTRRQLLVADPGGREMLISCGAALYTARLAPRSLGRILQTDVLPDRAACQAR